MNNSKPKVSAIMIFYNAQKFMDEAIQSVLGQSMSDWELLLADDGSADNSPAIAKEYAQRYQGKVRYLQHPDHKNHGMSATRNLGLRHAQGEFVAFLDADDVWFPQKMEHQSKILDLHLEAALVYGPTFYWYGWTGRPEDIKRDKLGRLGVIPGRLFKPPELLTLYLTSGGGFVPGTTGGQMMRKSALESIGGYEKNFGTLYEDQAVLAKLVLNYPVYVDETSTIKYRQHPDSACNQCIRSGEYNPYAPHKLELIYLQWLSRYIARNKVTDQQLKAALNGELFPYRHPVVRSIIQKWRKFLGTKQINNIRAILMLLANYIRAQSVVRTINLDLAYESCFEPSHSIEDITNARTDQCLRSLLKDSVYVQFLNKLKDKPEVSDQDISETQYFQEAWGCVGKYGSYQGRIKNKGALTVYCRGFLSLFYAMKKRVQVHWPRKRINALIDHCRYGYPYVFLIKNSQASMVYDGAHRLACLHVLGERYAKIQSKGIITGPIRIEGPGSFNKSQCC